MGSDLKAGSLLPLASRLKIEPQKLALCTDWEEAMQVSPVRGLRFLEKPFVLEASAESGLTQEMGLALVDFAREVAKDPDLLAFFWYCRHRVLNDATLVKSWEEPWPPLDDYLGKDAGLLNALVMLSAVPEMLATYKKYGIPEALRLETVGDMRLWMETDLYFLKHQRWGITPWIARWLCKHWQARILQFGRLQFVRDSFGLPLRVYRRRGAGELAVFPEAGQRFNAQGGAWGDCCGDAAPSWVSEFEDGGSYVSGHPISGMGLVERRLIRLELGDWELVLKKGDDVLGVSIPTGGPLTHEACGDSFNRALEGFPRYFPEFKFEALWIKSWLMDPRFDGMLPPEANIVRLQRELFLYPGIQGDNAQIYNRVFGWGVSDLSNAPRKSSLQKTVAEYLEKGGHFHGGYAFALKSGFHWGAQVYRAAPPLKGI